MIKIISIGIIVGFTLVLYGIGYFLYKKDKEEEQLFDRWEDD